MKSKDPKGRCLYELLDAAFKAWDAGVIRAKDYDAVAHAIIERIPILRKERKIGAYYARHIEEVHRTNNTSSTMSLSSTDEASENETEGHIRRPGVSLCNAKSF